MMMSPHKSWRIDLAPDGTVRMVHNDTLMALIAPLGPARMERLTDVVFDEAAQAWVVRLVLCGTPVPNKTFPRRADAITAEVAAMQALQRSYATLCT